MPTINSIPHTCVNAGSWTNPTSCKACEIMSTWIGGSWGPSTVPIALPLERLSPTPMSDLEIERIARRVAELLKAEDE